MKIKTNELADPALDWDFAQSGQYASLRHMNFPGTIQIKADDKGFVIELWNDADEPNLVASTYALYTELEGACMSNDIFIKAASDNGEVAYQGKTYALLSQAELTNRIFPGWWGDAREGDEYTSEWSAPAIGEDGEEYVVVWQFDAIKGQEPEDDSSLPWDQVREVIPA